MDMRAIGAVARAMFWVLTLVLVECCIAGCSVGPIRKPLDLSEAKFEASHDPIVIDGSITTPGEWQAAATVPVPKHGKAAFLWDEKGIYGRLWGPDGISTEADEKICVSLNATNSDGSGIVRLYFTTLPSFTSPTRVMMQAVRGFWSDPPEPVDPALLPFAGHTWVEVRHWPRKAKVSSPWEAEFFLPWEVLSPSWRTSQSLWIRVFWIRGERPYSTLQMGPY